MHPSHAGDDTPHATSPYAALLVLARMPCCAMLWKYTKSSRPDAWAASCAVDVRGEPPVLRSEPTPSTLPRASAIADSALQSIRTSDASCCVPFQSILLLKPSSMHVMLAPASANGAGHVAIPDDKSPELEASHPTALPTDDAESPAAVAPAPVLRRRFDARCLHRARNDAKYERQAGNVSG